MANIKKQKISIVIPAYNEEKRIGATLVAYSEYFENLRKQEKIEYEILVVINNTKDRTEDIVKNCEKKNRRIKHLNLIKGGKGYAVIEGFKDALKRDNDLIGFVDADMATSPEEYWKIASSIGDFDGVIASRGLKDSVVKTSFKRRLTNRGFNLVVRLFLHLPYRDTQCGAKLFKRGTIEYLTKQYILTQWSFDIDLLHKLGHKKILEVPTVWADKEGSKIKLITPLKMFSSVVRLRFIYSPFSFIVRAYDLMPESMKLHNM